MGTNRYPLGAENEQQTLFDMSKDYSSYSAGLEKRVSEMLNHLRNGEYSQAEKDYWQVNHALTQIYGTIRGRQADKMSNR